MNIQHLRTICLIGVLSLASLTPNLSAQLNEPILEFKSQSTQPTELGEHSKECIAELAKVLELKPDQEQAIRDVYSESEVAQEAAWKKFNMAQSSAINIEAEMYSSAESRLTDSQKKTFKAARMKQQEKMTKGTYTSDTSRKLRETSGRKSPFSEGARDKPNQEPTRTVKKSSSAPFGVLDTPAKSFVQTAIISPFEQVVVSLGMNSDENAECDLLCGVYRTRLDTAWKEIHCLRSELVNQKVVTLNAITEILTNEQRAKLEKNRAIASKKDGSEATTKR